MSRPVRSILAFVFIFCSLPARGDEALLVDAMHYPAWLVRDHRTLPLMPGTGLRQDDLIRTGEGGRVQLRLADGSRIRLGQQSRSLVQTLPAADRAAEQLVSMRILRGVFHVIPDRSRLPFRIDLGDVSAGFSGADVWGRADSQNDALCLLQGEVEVESPGGDVQRMSEELSCYVKPRGQAALAIDRVDLQQHRAWLDETKLNKEKGIVVAGGEWQLVLISLSDADSAERVLAAYHELGFAAQRKTVERGGRTLHRLLLPAFESIEAALSAADRIEKMTGARETWVWKKSD